MKEDQKRAKFKKFLEDFRKNTPIYTEVCVIDDVKCRGLNSFKHYVGKVGISNRGDSTLEYIINTNPSDKYYARFGEKVFSEYFLSDADSEA